MMESVIVRLNSFGYIVSEDDECILTFTIKKIEDYVKNSCNLCEIPDSLYYIMVDMVCGHFLYEKRAINADEFLDMNLEPVIKQIKEGDTSITFAVKDGENAIDTLIDYLISNNEKKLLSYRCMRW